MESNLPPPPPTSSEENVQPPLPPSLNLQQQQQQPQPLQIIVTGDSDNDFFQLKQDNLQQIIDKIPNPSGTKVAVISVVGAFRTGKSFLLNFFLRYLRSDSSPSDGSLDW